MFGFKKKKEEELPSELGKDLEFPGEGKFPPAEQAFEEPTPLSQTPKPFPPLEQEPAEPSAFGTRAQPMSQPMQQPAQYNYSGDKIEIVIAKLDHLKAVIEMLNQRISNIEQKLERRW